MTSALYQTPPRHPPLPSRLVRPRQSRRRLLLRRRPHPHGLPVLDLLPSALGKPAHGVKP